MDSVDGFFNKLKSFDFYMIFLILTLVGAFVVRLYYFTQFWDQAFWYDESEYVLRAFMFNDPTLVDTGFAHKRPILMSFIWSLLLKFGLGEFFMKLLQVVLSSLTVWGVYLVGKEAKSKKVGLIMAAFFAAFYLHIFFSIRTLLDVPSLFFLVFSVYFFLKWYNKDRVKDIVYSSVFAGLAFLTFYTPAHIIPLFFLMFVIKKPDFYKHKEFYYVAGTLLLVVLPWMIWSLVKFGNPIYGITTYAGTGEILEGYDYGFMGFLRVIPSALFPALFYVFLFGVGKFLLDVVMSWKDILYRRNKKYDIELFFLVWMLFYSLAMSITVVHVEPRYMLPAFVGVAYFIAKGLLFAVNLLRNSVKFKHSTQVLNIVLVVVVVLLLIPQLSHADGLIENKAGSFAQQREAGDYLASVLEEGEAVLTCSYNVVYEAYTGTKVFQFDQDVALADSYIENENIAYLVLDGHVQNCAFDYAVNNPETFRLAEAFFFDEARTQPIVLVYEVVN